MYEEQDLFGMDEDVSEEIREEQSPMEPMENREIISPGWKAYLKEWEEEGAIF